MTVVSLDCLCWQVRRFGLRSEAKSKARISFGPDWLALCLGTCFRDELDKADTGSIPAASTINMLISQEISSSKLRG